MELNNINYWPGQSGYDYHITQQIPGAVNSHGRVPRPFIEADPLVIKRSIFLSIHMALGFVCITLGITGDRDKWDNCAGD